MPKQSKCQFCGQPTEWAIKPSFLGPAGVQGHHPECWEKYKEREQKKFDAAVLRKSNPQIQSTPPPPPVPISADAKYVAGRIITHLWIIFVGLPVAVGIVWMVVQSGRR